MHSTMRAPTESSSESPNEAQLAALSEQDRRSLLLLARQSIEAGLPTRSRTPLPELQVSTTLQAQRAAFVTLYIRGALHGCIGSIEPRYPLFDEVWRNAAAAAFSDPRFPALTFAEWAEVTLHISVLEPLQALRAESERALLEQLRPGIDGLVLELDGARATFLPSVWEQLPSPHEFVGHLKAKAGWPASFWSQHIQAWRYGTESFGE